MSAYLLISSFAPVVGGVQSLTRTLSRVLAAGGTDVSVLTRRLPGTPRYSSLGNVAVHRLGLESAGKWGSLTYAVHTFFFLLMRHQQHSVVHVHNIDTPLLVGILAKLLLRQRLVATIHGEMKLLRKQRTPLGRIRLGLMKQSVDVYCALTPLVELSLAELGIPSRRIRRIANGVDTTHFRRPTTAERESARARLSIRSAEFVAVFVGRLVRLKNVELILATWESLQGENATLIIVGDGPGRGSLEQMARERDLRRVLFVGETGEVRQYLWAADCFLLLSWEEGLPMALLEAMATGLPVIVSAIPGMRSVVHPNENGILVRGDETSDVEEALRYLKGRPRARLALGQQARRTIVEEYSLESVAEAHQRLYRELAG